MKETYLFSSLDDEQMEKIRSCSQTITLSTKEALFEHGQPAERFYLLCKGQIKLFRLSADGDEKVIEIIYPGQTFAEAIMFMEDHTYPVSAQAIERSEICSFDMKTYIELLKESNDACFSLMGAMSRRLHMRINEINNLTLENATFRLVNYMLEQVPVGAVEMAAIHLDTPKSIIASRLSIQPETFSRIMSKLTRLGLINVHGNNISLNDVSGLRDLL
jgi:CRP-like cAMP-binding protein